MDSVFWWSIATAVGALLVCVVMVYRVIRLMNEGGPDQGEK
jgi:hypothetical protein